MGKPAQTVALWSFDETNVGQYPIDRMGNVLPLMPVDGVTPPTVADGVRGLARMFGGDKAFTARGVVGRTHKLALTRSLTIEAILHYDQAGGAQFIVSHGNDEGGTDPERNTWGIHLNTNRGLTTLNIGWTGNDGVTKHSSAILIQGFAVNLIPDDGWFYLAVVREWVAENEIITHAYVNGVLAGSATETGSLPLEGGTDGELVIGAQWDVDGAEYVNFWNQEIDQLRISDGARSGEEVAQIYARMFVYPGFGYDVMRQLLPPGEAYSRDESSFIQRELQVEGDGIGYAWGKATELHDDHHPDRAWSQLERWERVTGLAPGTADSFAKRRERILGFLRKIHGYNRDGIKTSVQDLLDLDPDQIVIVESSNAREDNMQTAGAYWELDRSDGVNGTIAYNGGLNTLELSALSGGDSRWSYGRDNAVKLRTTVPSWGQRSELIGFVRPSGLTTTGSHCGIYLQNRVSGMAIWFGVYNDAGTKRYAYQVINAAGAAPVVDTGVVSGGTYFPLRMKESNGQLLLQIAAPDPTQGEYFLDWVTMWTVDMFDAAVQWCGFHVSCPVNPSVVLNRNIVYGLRLWCPRARHVFQAFIYRDPTIFGTTVYDRAGAQLVVNKVRPAHVSVLVIEALVALCDDPFTRVDGEPCS